jgi:hypothetical protein
MAEPGVGPVYTPPPPAKKTPKGVKTPRTRMAPRLAPIPHVYDPELDKVKKVVKKPRKPFTLVGRVFTDDQFDAKLYFSPAYGDDAGRTYGATMGITPGAGSPEALKEIYVRLEVTQHRVDPLLQGFRCEWEPPPGWTTVDGIALGGPTWDEAISNPVYITRVFKTPADPETTIGFRVRVTAKYKP